MFRYGKPGVEFSAQHPEEESVNKIFFLREQVGTLGYSTELVVQLIQSFKYFLTMKQVLHQNNIHKN